MHNGIVYCLRHDTYYTDDTHGASFFRNEATATPEVKAIESFAFSCTASPQSLSPPSPPRVGDRLEEGTQVDKDACTWAQRASFYLP